MYSICDGNKMLVSDKCDVCGLERKNAYFMEEINPLHPVRCFGIKLINESCQGLFSCTSSLHASLLSNFFNKFDEEKMSSQKNLLCSSKSI